MSSRWCADEHGHLRAIGGLTEAQVAAVLVVALERGQAFAAQLTQDLTLRNR